MLRVETSWEIVHLSPREKNHSCHVNDLKRSKLLYIALLLDQILFGALPRFSGASSNWKVHKMTSGKTRLKKGLPRQQVQHGPTITTVHIHFDSRMVAPACHSTFESFAPKELGPPSLDNLRRRCKITTVLLTCVNEHQCDLALVQIKPPIFSHPSGLSIALLEIAKCHWHWHFIWTTLNVLAVHPFREPRCHCRVLLRHTKWSPNFHIKPWQLRPLGPLGPPGSWIYVLDIRPLPRPQLDLFGLGMVWWLRPIPNMMNMWVYNRKWNWKAYAAYLKPLAKYGLCKVPWWFYGMNMMANIAIEAIQQMQQMQQIRLHIHHNITYIINMYIYIYVYMYIHDIFPSLYLPALPTHLSILST